MAVYKRDIVDINLETGNIHRSFLKHSIGYMDQKADHFGIRAYRDGVPVDLTGVSVQGVFMPPQGSPIAITSGNIVDFNEAEVVLPQACYNYDGQFTLAIKLVDSTNSVTGTMRIVDGMVDNTHASGTVAPTEAVPTYQEIIAVYEDLVDALADVADYAENFAPAFAAGTANAAGSYVMYEGDLYLLPDGHTANTTWANTTKTQVTTGGEMVKLAQADSDLKNALNQLNETSEIALTSGYAYTVSGSKINASPTSSSSFNNGGCASVDCSPGDMFVINGEGANTARLWGFIDSDRNILSISAPNAVEENLLIVAPTNASKLIINTVTKSASVKGITPKVENKNQDICIGALAVENIPIFIDGAIQNNGSTINPSSVSYPTTKHKHVLISCNYGDVFTLTGTGGSTYRLWSFVDSSNNIITKADASVTETNNEIITPSGAVKLLVNVQKAYNYALYKGKSVNSKITATEENITDVQKVMFDALPSDVSLIEMTKGYYVDVVTTPISITPKENISTEYAVVSCVEGDVFTIHAVGGSTVRAYAFLDSSYVALYVSGVGVTIDSVVVAPENAAYLIVNNIVSETSKYYHSYKGSIQDTASKKGIWQGYFRKRINIDFEHEYIRIPAQRLKIGSSEIDINAVNLAYDNTKGQVSLYYDRINNIFNVSYSALTTPPTGYYFMGGWSRGFENMAAINGNYIVNGKYPKAAEVTQTVEDNAMRPGKEDMGWVCYWMKPEIMSFKRIRNKLYWTFTSASGAKGIAEYDFDSGLIVKRNLMKRPNGDLHNDVAVHIYDDGKILCAFPTGHNDDNIMHIRKSKIPECLDYFTDDLQLECGDNISYAQLVYSSNKTYLFYRNSTLKWAYRYSEDEGNTWSDEVDLIVSDAQYYCIFQKTTTDSVLRVIMYTNPQASPRDTKIRQAFFHTDTDTLYNSDNTTVLGTEDVDKDNITVIIPNDETLTNQRLFDVAVSAVDRPMVLYAAFSTNYNSVYRLYDSGTVIDIVGGGNPLGDNPYFLSCKFIGTDKIIAFYGSGSDGGKDIGAIFAYQNGAISTVKTIWEEVRGSVPIRNYYPIVDPNEKALMWLRGKFGTTYTDFNADAMIYLIEEDKVL